MTGGDTDHNTIKYSGLLNLCHYTFEYSGFFKSLLILPSQLTNKPKDQVPTKKKKYILATKKPKSLNWNQSYD